MNWHKNNDVYFISFDCSKKKRWLERNSIIIINKMRLFNRFRFKKSKSDKNSLLSAPFALLLFLFQMHPLRQKPQSGGSAINPNIFVQNMINLKNRIDLEAVFILLIGYAIWFNDLLGFLGRRYEGFVFSRDIFYNTNWIYVMTSGVVVFFLVMHIIINLKEKNFNFILVCVMLGVVYSSLVEYIFRLNEQYRFLGPIFLVGTIVIIVSVLTVLKKLGANIEPSEFATYMLLVLVNSFLWVKTKGSPSVMNSVVHMAYINFFCLFFISSRVEVDKIKLYIVTAILLVVDAFLYKVDFGYMILSQLPLFIFFTSMILYYYTQSSLAKLNIWTITAVYIILVLMSPVAYAQELPLKEKAVTGYQKFMKDIKDFFKRTTEKGTQIVSGQIDYATGGYSGIVEKNQYESLGVYFANVRASEPIFYNNERVNVWATIRSKTYQDMVVVDFNCNGWRQTTTGNTKVTQGRIVVPEDKFPVFQLEENDVECNLDANYLEPGPNTITLTAEYNFVTNAYLKAYFIDRNIRRTLVKEGVEDPLREFGIQDTNPVTVFTNGPVEIGMKAGPLIEVDVVYLNPPNIVVTLRNRQQIEDKDSRIIRQWEGNIKRIIELVILTPPGVVIPNIGDCKKESFNPQKCNCNKPFKTYSKNDCTTSCTDKVQKPCVEACKEDASCKKECARIYESCNKECDILFKEDSAQGTGKKEFNAYALDIDPNDMDYKEIGSDKYVSFRCTIEPLKLEILDPTPITTRYFRVRARYDYKLENSVEVDVEKALGTISRDLANTFDQIAGKDVDPNLLKAIAFVESSVEHCKDGRDICSRDEVKFSGSSLGIMQINVRSDGGHPEWKTSAPKEICGEGKTVYDIDCNIRLGKAILLQYYNEYKDGVSDSKLSRHCPRDANFNGVNLYELYKSYIGWDAALRAYNGWGCNINNIGNKCNEQCTGKREPAQCVENCISHTVRYVEKVKKWREDIIKGEISSELLDRLQRFDYYIPKLLEIDPPPSAAAANTENAKNKITVTWPASPTPDVRYNVIRYKKSNTNPDKIFTDKTSPFPDPDELQTDATYYYEVIAVKDNEESLPVSTSDIVPRDTTQPSSNP